MGGGAKRCGPATIEKGAPMLEDMTDSEYFTALLSHDISNYNQTIRGYLEMLLNEQMGPVTAEQSRALGRCLKQSRRIQSLIESVRLLHELDGAEVQLRELSLDAAIKEALEVVQNDFADREIRARFTAAARATRAEPQLTAVFVHIFNNAVKFNTCDLVEIDVQVARVNDRWEIRIVDNGGGVPAARSDSLFERYRSHEIHGSGLGLSVVREMMKRWGGEIRIAPPPTTASARPSRWICQRSSILTALNSRSPRRRAAPCPPSRLTRTTARSRRRRRSAPSRWRPGARSVRPARASSCAPARARSARA